MTATKPTMTQAESHGHSADCAAQRMDTYVSYLEWSTDPAQRRWARRMAFAARLEADAHRNYAATLRAREASA